MPPIRELPEWMNSGGDERILEALDYGLKLTPAVIGENIGYNRNYINRRLQVLRENGFVEREGGGFYSITQEGSEFIRNREPEAES